MEYYLAVKRDEALEHLSTRISDGDTLKVRNQTQRSLNDRIHRIVPSEEIHKNRD